ncbi:MAG: hypothetical protein IH988_04405, partial [Planctomycetes bacterium]|nr:hypothetical protein [Planctomycetota bacterium]
HGLKQVFYEGVTPDNLADYKALIETIRGFEKHKPKGETPIEELMLWQYRQDLLQLGAPGRWLLSGDLAEVLENISSVIRQRIELFAMVKGLTAEGRLSGWVLFALPFIVFLAVNLLNPDYAAQLFTDPRGKILLAVAIGMQLMGLAMIRWIVNIKV